MTVSIVPQAAPAATSPIIMITVAARCGHTAEQAIRPGAEAAIRQVAAQHPCQACKSNRVEPIRFASGWGWRTGR